MKEDYLWDKTGEADAEIERLENALRVLQYRETAPPALPAVNVLPFKNESMRRRRRPRRQFRFAAATMIAACLLFGLLALAAWFQILKNNIETSRQEIQANQPQNVSQPPQSREEIKRIAGADQPEGNSIEKPPAVKKFASPRKTFVRTIYRVHKAAPAAARIDLAAHRRRIRQIARPDVYLTEEERYAYNQLMLALSITSSKLKMVKDKAEGLDEKKTFVKTENN